MYKRKTTKSIFVELDEASYQAIKNLAAVSGKARSQTAFMLINTAAAYNFTSDGEYICCKLKRSEPIFSIDKAGKPAYPREIMLCTSDKTLEKLNKEKTRTYIKSTFADTAAQFRNMSAENDIIHTDDIAIKTIGGESSAYFQGIGAYADIIDVQMMNAVKTLGTLMNRRSSGSYALSTVEFKVIVDMLEPRQRAEKRLVESIARIWLRVHGYNATVKYTPNPIEWQTMLDKIDYSLKNQQFYRRSEEYGHISPDEAAQKINGSEKAYADRTGLFEYIKKMFNKGGENSDNSENENGGDIN